MITRDKIAGSFYGLALGDALGRPTEFMSLKHIKRTYGSYGVMSLPRPALFTDDTQMTLAVARAVGAARWFGPNELVRTLTTEFLRWAVQDPSRAPGVTCVTSVRRLAIARVRHEAWTTATTVSRGCGANMRVAPTALLPDADLAVSASQLQAALTHGDPVAIAATELTALAIRYAAEGADLVELPRMLLARAYTQRGIYRDRWLRGLHTRWVTRGNLSAEVVMERAWDRIADTIRGVMMALADSQTPYDVCRTLGAAWTADEALACALYFAVRFGGVPPVAISMAARTSGDSDSIACITGAIVGAYHGESVWPLHWRARIERRGDVEDAVDTIWQLWE